MLDGVSLAIGRGEFVALVGQSGAGKTTLLKAINRLAEIDSGTVTVDGENVAALPPAELRRKIGYVFQGIGLFPHMTVAENIGLVPKLQGGEARGSANCSTSSHSRANWRRAIRRSFRAGRPSASASPGRWRRNPQSC